MTPTPPHIVELERLGHQIAELSAHLDAATARRLELIREFDERGGWDNGFSSCAAWLTWRTGLDPGAARERVRVARALPALPRIAQALARGELSYSKVRALTRVATPETEERLLGIGHGRARGTYRPRLAAPGSDRRDQRGHAPPSGPRPAGVSRRRRHARDPGPARARMRRGGRAGAGGFEDAPTVEQQHADALVMLAESVLHHGIDPGAPGERYQVVVHVDAEAAPRTPISLPNPERPDPAFSHRPAFAKRFAVISLLESEEL